MADFQDAARQVMARCEALGGISQSESYLDRRYLTEEHRRANQLVAQWMLEAGMTSWQDAAGNLWGRLESPLPDAPRLIIGSHLDTVPNGGKYDGMLGVIAPITLASLLKNKAPLPFHVDIVGFGDEEGTRFGSTLLGSRALTGRWPAEWAQLKDADGINLVQAMNDFGLDFDAVPGAAINPATVMAYLEFHIEQGPVLESQHLPVGIVTAIAGARRFNFTVTGMAGHAGTVPMHLRQDALCCAAEMVLTVEQLAKANDVVATVGKIVNRPNGVNVISGMTQFSLDIRSEHDKQRDDTLEQIMQSLHSIAQARGVSLSVEETHQASAVQCAPDLQDILEKAVVQSGIRPLRLASGAGHDAMEMARICPVAMLFMRCDRGISHHPDEAILEQDVCSSLEVLYHAISHISV